MSDIIDRHFIRAKYATMELIGTIVAIGAVIVSIISVMFFQIAPKANALIVIYGPPQFTTALSAEENCKNTTP